MNARPASAYRRIDQNKVFTFLLLCVFLVLVTPIFGFLTSYLAVWLVIYFVPVSSARDVLMVDLGAVVLMVVFVMARVLRMRGRLPDVMGARALPREGGLAVWRRLENLSIAAGLPTPKLFVLPDWSLNAFTTGPDPDRACVVVTQGLLETVGPRELDGVFAHELAHIANYDTRLNSTVAAILGTVRLPTPIYWLFVAFSGMVVVNLDALVESFSFIQQAMDTELGGTLGSELGPLAVLVRPLIWAAYLSQLIGLPLALFWPVIGRLLQSAISRRRELLADAEAVTMTRDPEGLASALAKIAGGAREAAAGWKGLSSPLGRLAAVEHQCIGPLDADVLSRTFGTHPSFERRIGLLQSMAAAPEAASAAAEEPVPEFAAAAAAAVEAPAAEAASPLGQAVLIGFLAGAALQTALTLGTLYRLMASPIPPEDLRAMLFGIPFGFGGLVAAYAAMRSRRRFYWWPIVLMFVFGPYLTSMLVLSGGPVGRSVGGALLVYLVSLLEPLAGSALGAISKGGILDLVRRLSGPGPGTGRGHPLSS